MGKLRNAALPSDVAWVQEGSWARSLGAPIGNDLDHEDWWAKKLEAVRSAAKHWYGLRRCGFMGRNLIVQAMFFGRLRYWLYSLPMSRKTRNSIQHDANQLWWARDPDLNNKKRIRRFVAKETAIGPKSKGGLNALDWNTHVSAFQPQWITRYVDPSDSTWKRILDEIILKDRHGKEAHSTKGRGVLFANLTTYDKTKILKSLPKRATYIKECLKAHWRLNLTQDALSIDGIHSEPLWRNHRFHFQGVDAREERSLARNLNLRSLSDILNHRRKPRTRKEWMHYIHSQKVPITWNSPQASYVALVAQANPHRQMAERLVALFRQIPKRVTDALRSVPVVARFSEEEPRYIEKKNGSLILTLGQPDGKFLKLTKDSVGKTHTAKKTYNKAHNLVEVAWWSPKDADARVLGPRPTAYPLPEGWLFMGERIRLDRFSVNLRTRLIQHSKMRPPKAETTWPKYVEHDNKPIPFNKIWKLRGFFTTPRDEFTWLRLKHRGLYVSGTNPSGDTSCRACPEKETMYHLATCPVLAYEFWDPLMSYMDDLNLKTPPMGTSTDMFLILGCVRDGDKWVTIDSASAGLLAIAWRCLYAELTSSKIHGHPINLERALLRTFQLTISRLRAYGLRWKRCSAKNLNTSLKWIVPEPYRDRGLIKQTFDGALALNTKLFSITHSLNTPAAATTPRSPRQGMNIPT